MISAARGEAVFNVAYFTNEREVWGSVSSHSLNSQQFCVNSLQCLPNSVCNILHPAFPKKTWACTIFYSSGIVWIGGGGFGRVGARREWCRWQLWLLSSARGTPQPACDAAVFCIQGKQLYPAELSGGITHHWRHWSPDAENILFYVPFKEIWMADKWG